MSNHLSDDTALAVSLANAMQFTRQRIIDNIMNSTFTWEYQKIHTKSVYRREADGVWVKVRGQPVNNYDAARIAVILLADGKSVSGVGRVMHAYAKLPRGCDMGIELVKTGRRTK